MTKYTDQDLKTAVIDNDNERVHGILDDLMRSRLEELDPTFLEKLDNIVGDMEMWFA